MKIAYGTSRTAAKWKNSEITWEDFCKRVSQTLYTAETAAEFRSLPKAQQDAIKDIGGFVGGHLKDGRRKKNHVLCRSMLTLDMDDATPETVETIQTLYDFQCCLYSTHKHTPQFPRLRLCVPLSREVTEEEYPAVARMLASEIGMDLFDDTTYEPHRLMYWPSTSRGAEFVFANIEGTLLNPDEYLAKYADWHDVSSYPVSSRQAEAIQRAAKEQQDPLTKEGVVGAFCKAYAITDAIDTFLSDVYAPSAVSGRYDYIPADSSAGVVIYDDTFAYSHHATDPASGRLMNAFDVVRLHKFGAEDEKKSYQKMTDFALQDAKVKAVLAEERRKQAAAEFTEILEPDDLSPAPARDWENELEYDRTGNLKPSLDNLVRIVRNDPLLQSIAFNKHRDGIDARGRLPWTQMKTGWNDTDYASLKVYLNKRYGIYTPTKTKDAVTAVAAERAYHPIQEYLEHLPDWDGVARVDTLLIDYFGAEDSPYTRAVMRKTLIAAVARIYRPGTKFDSVLILNGPQGIGKSTFFYKLAGDWFSDSLSITDMKDKSGPEKLQGYWILELGELAGMRKTDVEIVKSFLSRVDDKYRASYGVSVESHPRQCVIVGSTNAENGFLRDITGNRRFWPVRMTGNSVKKAWQMTTEDVQQIWAETLVYYRTGEKLYLEGGEAKAAALEQANALETDEREGLVRAYLETPLPENWEELSLYERRNYLNGGEFDGKAAGVQQRETVCNMEIWCECFERDMASMKAADSYVIAALISKIGGWEKDDKRIRMALYGQQRVYRKIKKSRKK